MYYSQGRLARYAIVFLSTLGLVHPASAQEPAAQHTIAAAAGLVQFDLDGTGSTWGAAIRGTRALTDHVALEAGTLISRYDGGSGATMLVSPEAQVQYWWRGGPVRPYAGGGIGFARRSREGALSGTDLVLTAAGGVRVDLSDRLAALGELRLRGFERTFTGTTAEWMAGLSWRLGESR